MPVTSTSQWIVEEWARQLRGVLESMTGESPSVALSAGELTPEELTRHGGELFWWQQGFSVSPGTLVWIGAGASTLTDIGNRVLRSAGIEDADQENIRNTYLEIVNQALSGLAAKISGRVGKEVTCVDGKPLAPHTAPAVVTAQLDINFAELTLPMVIAFSSALADTPDPEASRAKPASGPRTGSAAAHDNKSIELLLDVELPVSISFGRAQLPLKDVIKLTTGSIVELNRALSEPVEVIVNNCVIARGEVVVVEGNYGIRIKQVLSRQERLRRLT